MKDIEIEAILSTVHAELKLAQKENAAVSYDVEAGFTFYGPGDDGIQNNTRTLRIEINGGAKDERITPAVVAEPVMP